MAEISRNKTSSNPTRKSSKRSKVNIKFQILAVLMMLFAVLLVIAVVSYSRSDEQYTEISFLDLINPFSDAFIAKTEHVTNALGLVGAIVSNVLINGTIGFGIIIFPLLLLIWGWVLLRKYDTTNTFKVTNYFILIGIIFSATMGIIGQIFPSIDKEWSGLVGAFLGDTMIRLIGKAGAVLIVLTSLLIVLVLAADLDIHKTIDRLKDYFDGFRNWFGLKRNGRKVIDVENDSIDETTFTIKKPDEEAEGVPVRKEKSKKILFDVPDETISTSEEELDVDEEGEVKEVIQEDVDDEREIISPIPKSETVLSENVDEEIDYVFPSVELLDSPRQVENVNDEELKTTAEQLKAKLANFGIDLESVSVTPGPVVTLYELVPASGVKISRIVSLENDLALALAAKGIRIIAPIPGKGTIGVEIPNHNPSIVNIRSVINSTKFRESKSPLPIAMGKTISGEVYLDDLSKMPHLLIAGSTGSGKSVGINSILMSLIYKLHPSDVKFVIIDPKKIELTLYKKLLNHHLATSPDFREEIITTPEHSVSILKSMEVEMERRYNRLAKAGVRNIADYNERIKSGKLISTEEMAHSKMPYIVVVIDELADLMITAAREIEEPIARLAQLARAVGIHLVVATQRPSVDVITGVIKANFPARIAYQVASKTDSRTILDMNGAETLLGNGDMLYLPSGTPKPIRIQNVFVSTDEVEAVMDHIAKQKGFTRTFKLPSMMDKKRNGMSGVSSERDDLFEEAAYLVVRHQQGSVSLVQRRLKVGYSRAARIIDELEAVGIVGPFDGSKAREVRVETEDELKGVIRSLE
jgi:S-DNA-T family DNA segregation ATPase FtsK/SpoIIIE